MIDNKYLTDFNTEFEPIYCDLLTSCNDDSQINHIKNLANIKFTEKFTTGSLYNYLVDFRNFDHKKYAKYLIKNKEFIDDDQINLIFLAGIGDIKLFSSYIRKRKIYKIPEIPLLADYAISQNRLEMFKWLYNRGVKYTRNVCYFLIKYGHFDLFKEIYMIDPFKLDSLYYGFGRCYFFRLILYTIIIKKDIDLILLVWNAPNPSGLIRSEIYIFMMHYQQHDILNTLSDTIRSNKILLFQNMRIDPPLLYVNIKFLNINIFAFEKLEMFDPESLQNAVNSYLRYLIEYFIKHEKNVIEQQIYFDIIIEKGGINQSNTNIETCKLLKENNLDQNLKTLHQLHRKDCQCGYDTE